MILIRKSGTPLKVGDKVTTFRGEQGELMGWREPHHEGSTGRVYCKLDGATYEWYPGVVDAQFVDELKHPMFRDHQIFRDHRCWKCNDGERACVVGNPNTCEYPHARND